MRILKAQKSLEKGRIQDSVLSPILRQAEKIKKDLTNEDLFYTKEDFRNFIEESEAQGVSIVPEIDAPGHSGAFTKVRPDLMLPQNQAVNGNAKRAGEQFDLSVM